MINHNLKLSHNIYKDTKRGTYYFRIKYYEKTGERKEIKRTGYKQRKEAVKACNAYMDETEGIGKINQLPFDELVQEYVEWYSARRKAFRALTWDDVNFDDDYIHINKTDYHGIVTAPKRCI